MREVRGRVRMREARKCEERKKAERKATLTRGKEKASENRKR